MGWSSVYSQSQFRSVLKFGHFAQPKETWQISNFWQFIHEHPALTHLKSLGYNGTETICENRLPAGCALKEKKKESIKRGREVVAIKSIKSLDVHFTQWVDNSVVRVAFTAFGMKPVNTALRYSSVEKKKVPVPWLLVVSKYNKSMGGVDRMDQNLSLYCIGIYDMK